MNANIIYPNVDSKKYLCRTNVKNIITPDSLQDIKNFANNLKLPKLKCFNLLNNENKIKNIRYLEAKFILSKLDFILENIEKKISAPINSAPINSGSKKTIIGWFLYYISRGYYNYNKPIKSKGLIKYENSEEGQITTKFEEIIQNFEENQQIYQTALSYFFPPPQIKNKIVAKMNAQTNLSDLILFINVYVDRFFVYILYKNESNMNNILQSLNNKLKDIYLSKSIKIPKNSKNSTTKYVGVLRKLQTPSEIMRKLPISDETLSSEHYNTLSEIEKYKTLINLVNSTYQNNTNNTKQYKIIQNNTK